MIVEFLKALAANIWKKPLATLTALLSGVTIILVQGDVVVPPEYQDTVTLIAGIISTVALFFANKVSSALSQAKASIAMKVTE